MKDELIEWYQENKRDLPWRRNTTAYGTWISEMMCQQTRIETVIPYYERFMKRFPTIEDLAKASMDEVLKLWQGLGYYARARNILKAAQMIVRDFNGIFPNTYNDVLSLPGIGNYTAGAILSIAYDLPYAAIDGNALRVLTRYMASTKDISLEETKKYFKKEVEGYSIEHFGVFNQAVMDLGAMVCLPNDKPKCEQCPLAQICLAHIQHEELSYPVKSKQVQKKIEEYTLFLIEIDDQILLHKRDAKGLLAGLYEFKNESGHLSIEEVRSKFKENLIRISPGPTKGHIFTHKKWIMYSYFLKLSDYSLGKNEIFCSRKQIEQEISIPQAFLQFLDEFH